MDDKVEQTFQTELSILKYSEALNNINTIINSTLDFEQIMQKVVVEAAKASNCEGSFICLRKKTHCEIKYAHGISEDISGLKIDDKDKLVQHFLKHQKPIVIDNTLNDNKIHESSKRLFIQSGIRSILAVPLIIKNNVIGILAFVYCSGPVKFTDKQLDFAGRLAVSVSLSLENSKLYETKIKYANRLENLITTRTAELKNTNTLLGLLSKAANLQDYLDSVVELIRTWSGCQCVGIRVLNEQGQIPYKSCLGFSKDFLSAENLFSIHSDQCTCTRIVKASLAAQEMKSVTKAGTFLCNDVNSYTKTLSELEKPRFRSYCMKSGFKSVAIVAIRYYDEILGVIHLTDKNAGRISEKFIEFLETTAPLIGEGIHRFNLEEELRKNYITQVAVNSLLNLPLENHTMEELLQKAAAIIIQTPWLRPNARAKVLLEGTKKPNHITLLTRDIESKTTEFDRKIIFEQGIYYVPIISSEKLLGILVLTTETDRELDRKEEELIVTIADTLANVIFRKRSKEELALSEKRFSIAFNASPNPMTITTLTEGRFLHVNDSFTHFIGYNSQEIIGNTSIELGLWFNPQSRQEIIKLLLANGSFNNYEAQLRTKSGENRICLFSAELIELDSQKCLLNVLTDITDLKKLEMEIARLDRLNLVGEMAAGIGHEVRNPMTSVRGYLQLFHNKPEYLQHKEQFELMIEELDRANAIITEFLCMAKNKAVSLKPQNLNDIMQNLLPLLRANAILTDKHIKNDLQEIDNLLLDEKEIRQLILNLSQNGFEAMSQGGILTIRTYMDNGKVILAVEDQGHGISPNHIDKLGTPFFSTKDSGTGLGLAVCFSIAARHNATITVNSGNTGSTFLVTFSPSSL